MIRSPLFVLSLVSLFVGPILAAAPLKVTTGSVTFLATGKPGFLKINGEGADVSGSLDKEAKGITGELTVPMAKFVTGIDLRDDHMKTKYFEVAKFPNAVLKITEFAIDAKGEASDKPFKGTLKFHGEEKAVSGTATAKVDGKKTNVNAKFPLTLSDYKIDIPTYAGVKVADTVEVNAVLTAEESGAPAAAVAAPAAKPAVPAKPVKK
ncbi:MAG: YceI family protein [Proteobacteria bacterium]|nr:MAG: YceI family protein [Pseudomonadota bacterium]